MTSDEQLDRLKTLPRRPIIAPAYDRRSSFFALILGVKLSRLGYDYRGRYTVPHEFSLPRPDKPYVARWKAEQQKNTLLGIVAAPLQRSLDWLTSSLGHLGLAILILVLVLRLLVLPLSLKAERDQILQRKLAPTVKALKDKLGADPQRLARAVRALYRREGLTPVRNLAGTMIQLIVFLVFFFVVSRAAVGSRQSFLWIPELGRPDPLYLLPAIVGASMCLYLLLSATRRTVWTILLPVLSGALLFAPDLLAPRRRESLSRVQRGPSTRSEPGNARVPRSGSRPARRAQLAAQRSGTCPACRRRGHRPLEDGAPCLR